MMRWLGIVCLALASAALVAACERADHDNVDRWLRTQKGHGKLLAALNDASLPADLRAHAAQNLIRLDDDAAVLAALEAAPAGERAPVLEALAGRLWEDARISGAMTKPTADQVGAKDALFALRPLAEGDIRARIDGYLIEWLTGGYYVGRARTGRVSGELIVHAIGPAATPGMLTATKREIDAPADDAGRRPQIELELLQSLAATGSPEAVAYLIALTDRAERDPALPERAIAALHSAFVDNGERFPLSAGAALVPHLAGLGALAGDAERPLRLRDQALAVMAAAPAPACVDALLPIVSDQAVADEVRLVAANAAVRCGRADALAPVAEALPTSGSYEARELRGVIWEPALALAEPARVAEEARALLASESWVARLVGVEILDHLALPESAAADARRLRALARDRTVLRGYWGAQENVPAQARKKPLRLGEHAKAVADALEGVSETGQET
ncbi:hypothetical protein [Haliangium ochraceum]|nr:hypothetical protein [Haliangium ochraceum]